MKSLCLLLAIAALPDDTPVPGKHSISRRSQWATPASAGDASDGAYQFCMGINPRNPRPFGMPPFATVLSDADVAAILGPIRMSWTNAAPLVSEFAVSGQRDTTD